MLNPQADVEQDEIFNLIFSGNLEGLQEFIRKKKENFIEKVSRMATFRTYSPTELNLKELCQIKTNRRIAELYHIKGEKDLTPLEFAAWCGQIKIFDYLKPKDYDISSVLFVAVMNGQISMVDHLIEHHNMNPNQKDGDDNTLLHLAALHGQPDLIYHLIKKYQLDLTKVNKNNERPLHIAALMGQNTCACIDALVENGEDPAVITSDNYTALHFAVISTCKTTIDHLIHKHGLSLDATFGPSNHPLLVLAVLEGNEGIIDHLINKHGLNPHITYGSRNKTLLHAAATNERTNIIDYLIIEQGLKASAVDMLGNNALHAAAAAGKFLNIYHLVKHHHLDSRTLNSNGNFALLIAAANGRISTIDHLVKCHSAYISLTTPNAEGNNVLHFAAMNGQSHCVEHLIKIHKMNPNIVNKKGLTALHLAARHEELACINSLLKNGADIEAVDSEGYTALHIVSVKGEVAYIESLLKNGADVKAISRYGETALHIAVRNIYAIDQSDSAQNLTRREPYITSIDTLIKHGLDPISTDPEGDTILHKAAQQGDFELISYLTTKYHFNLHATNNLGDTLLHLAAINGNTALINYLIAQGLNVDTTNRQGSTALMVATKVEPARLLIPKFPEKINAVDASNNNVLHYAAKYADIALIDYLIECGVNPYAINSLGNTPLLDAAHYERNAVVDHLLQTHQLNPEAVNHKGLCLLDYVCKTGDLNKVDFLLRQYNFNIADVLKNSCSATNHEITALLLAASSLFDTIEKGNFSELKNLLEMMNADSKLMILHWKNNNQTFIDLCISKNNIDCLTLILTHYPAINELEYDNSIFYHAMVRLTNMPEFCDKVEQAYPLHSEMIAQLVASSKVKDAPYQNLDLQIMGENLACLNLISEDGTLDKIQLNPSFDEAFKEPTEKAAILAFDENSTYHRYNRDLMRRLLKSYAGLPIASSDIFGSTLVECLFNTIDKLKMVIGQLEKIVPADKKVVLSQPEAASLKNTSPEVEKAPHSLSEDASLKTTEPKDEEIEELKKSKLGENEYQENRTIIWFYRQQNNTQDYLVFEDAAPTAKGKEIIKSSKQNEVEQLPFVRATKRLRSAP